MKLFLLEKTELRDNLGSLLPLPTKKVFSLLAYMAVHAKLSYERASLAAALWPESSPKEARDNLRNALSVLKKQLPTLALTSDRHSVSIDEGSISTDCACRSPLSELSQVFMPGYSDDWVCRYRVQRVRNSVQDALDRVKHLRDNNDVPKALDLLEETCLAAPLNIDAAKMRVSLLLQTDKPEEAEVAATQFSRDLARDIGVFGSVKPPVPEGKSDNLVTTLNWLLALDPKQALSYLVATRNLWLTYDASIALSAHERVFRQTDRSSFEWARAQAQYAMLFWVSGKLIKAMHVASRALDWAVSHQDSDQIVLLKSVLAYCNLSTGSFADAHCCARSAVDQLQSNKDRVKLAEAETTMSIIALHMGNFARSAHYSRLALQRTLEHGSKHEIAQATDLLVGAHLREGRLDLAYDRSRAAHDYFMLNGGKRKALWCRLGEAEVLAAAHDFERARRLLLEMKLSALASGGHSLAAMVEDRLAVAECELGETKTAAEAAARATWLRRKLGTVASIYERKQLLGTKKTIKDRMSRQELQRVYKDAYDEVTGAALSGL